MRTMGSPRLAGRVDFSSAGKSLRDGRLGKGRIVTAKAAKMRYIRRNQGEGDERDTEDWAGGH